MGVDDAEGGGLFLQMTEDAHQHDVLDDVGKAAGVKGVTVIHGAGVTTSRGESNRHSGAMQSIELWGAVAPLRISGFRVRCCTSPRNDGGRRTYPPRTGGISTWSRRQARRVDFLAGAELQILAQADPHFAEPLAVAGGGDGGCASAPD